MTVSRDCVALYHSHPRARTPPSRPKGKRGQQIKARQHQQAIHSLIVIPACAAPALPARPILKHTPHHHTVSTSAFETGVSWISLDIHTLQSDHLQQKRRYSSLRHHLPGLPVLSPSEEGPNCIICKSTASEVRGPSWPRYWFSGKPVQSWSRAAGATDVWYKILCPYQV